MPFKGSELLPVRIASGLNLTAFTRHHWCFICVHPWPTNCSGLEPAGFTPETGRFKNSKIAPGGHYLEMLPFKSPNNEMKLGSETNNECGL